MVMEVATSSRNGSSVSRREPERAGQHSWACRARAGGRAGAAGWRVAAAAAAAAVDGGDEWVARRSGMFHGGEARVFSMVEGLGVGWVGGYGG
jgi:hypothetical protein